MKNNNNKIFNKKRIITMLLFFVLFISFPYQSKSQVNRIPNLANYDYRTLHFGFILGYNQFSALLKTPEQLPNPETILGINVDSQHGFQVGIIGDLRLFEYARLRLTPSIVFGDRKFNFSIIDKGVNKTVSSNVEAIYLETPLEFKIQTKRWHNFRPYIIVGAKYAFDLASLKRKKTEDEETFLRFENNDWLYTAGVGFDFYLEYFKFGIELKSSFSFKDRFIHEDKPYANIISSYKTQIFYLNLTFE